MEWISTTGKEKDVSGCCYTTKAIHKCSKLMELRTKQLEKLIIEAKMAELDLHNKRSKAKEKTPPKLED